MAIELNELTVMGIVVENQDMAKIRFSIIRTYERLQKSGKQKGWSDLEFCKTQIASLWDAIYRTLSTVSQEEPRQEDVDARKRITTDSDNQQFLIAFGEQLKEDGALTMILQQLQKVDIAEGSLKVFFKDALTNERRKIEIEIPKLLKQIGRQTSKVRTGSKHFVEWAKENKKPIITYSMIAGVVITSLIAINYIGVLVALPKLLITAVIAMICLIYEAMGTYDTIDQGLKTVARRIGITV